MHAHTDGNQVPFTLEGRIEPEGIGIPAQEIPGFEVLGGQRRQEQESRCNGNDQFSHLAGKLENIDLDTFR
jgi:hypothetical protein